MPVNEINGILGSGVYFTKNKMKVEDLAKKYNLDYKSMVEEHGIIEIHVADNNETELLMAEKAAKDAISDSKLTADRIPLVIYCKGLSRKKLTMPCSSLIIEKLGIKNAYGFDIDAGFIGGLIGIQIANDIISSNPNIDNALVVASQEFDELYLFGDEASRLKHMIFGDGAAAVILSKSAVNNKIIASSFIIDHYTNFLNDLLWEGTKDTNIVNKAIHEMDVMAIVKKFHGTKIMSKLTERWVENAWKSVNVCLSSVNLDIKDVDHFVKTQLSIAETKMLSGKLNIDPSKIYNSSSDRGHLGHADILSNMHLTLKGATLRSLEVVAVIASNYDCSAGSIVLRI